MTKYRIFAGMNNEYRGIHEFINEDEAMHYAWQEALEDLESYGGLHGYPSPDNYEDEDMDEDECWEQYMEDAESWLNYEVKEVEEGVKYDEEGEPVSG